MPANSTCCDSKAGYCPDQYYCATTSEGEECYRSQLGGLDPNALPQLSVIKVDSAGTGLSVGSIIGILLAAVIICSGCSIALVHFLRNKKKKEGRYSSAGGSNSVASVGNGSIVGGSMDDNQSFKEMQYHDTSRYYDGQPILMPVAEPHQQPQYAYFQDSSNPIAEEYAYLPGQQNPFNPVPQNPFIPAQNTYNPIQTDMNQPMQPVYIQDAQYAQHQNMVYYAYQPNNDGYSSV
ncbi:hypothetical protein HK096_006251, partial [Nowakowskiella sp. JEL0078]